MGKGRPTPRETAKEKKAKPQKAVSTRASSKKAAAAPPPKKSAPPNSKKLTPERESGTLAGRPARSESYARPESSSRPANDEVAGKAERPEAVEVPVPPPATGSAAKPAEPGAAQKPSAQQPAVRQPVARQTGVQTGSAPAQPVKAEPKAQAEPEAMPEGEPGELDGVRLPPAAGKVGVFGGPKDRSVKPDDKLGLPTGRHYQFEQFRSLNPKSYYCAMRWEYRQQHMSAEEGKRWWANKKIAVTNPANNKTVVVRAVDYGPHENTGLTIAISPGAAEAIGVEPGQQVVVDLAEEKAQLGPATEPSVAAK